LYAGPSNCCILPMILRSGKCMKDYVKGYSGTVRHRNPLLCSQRALAYHLVQRFTLDDQALPDPANKREWLKAALFPGSNPHKNVCYQTQYNSIKQLKEELGLQLNKVTHIFRKGGTRFLEAAGVKEEVRQWRGCCCLLPLLLAAWMLLLLAAAVACCLNVAAAAA
jgi:Centromere DNA-binding protein complex CBF3 subunit, domain 2